MSISNIAVNILSHLDSPTSLAPVVVKDGSNITGRTLMAEENGGEHEARERFIEEFGTGALWLGGIPLSRLIYDSVVFKKNGLDPEVSIEKLPEIDKQTGKLKEVVKPQQLSPETLKELSPGAKEEGVKLVEKYLKLNKSKFLISTFVPFALLTLVLPKLNQQLSKQIILSRALKEKEKLNRQKQQQPVQRNQVLGPLAFTEGSINAGLKSDKLKQLEARFRRDISAPTKIEQINGLKQNPGFSGIGTAILNVAASAQRDPVNNMILLDLGISGNRVTFVPRNNQERVEYGVKEGGIIFFLFFAQGLIQKGFNKLAKAINRPIDLDFKTLFRNEKFTTKMKELHSLESKQEQNESIAKLTKVTNGASEPPKEKGFFEKVSDTLSLWFGKPKPVDTTYEKESYDFIRSNHGKDDYLTLHTAKKTGLLQLDKKNASKLDERKYIDTTKIKNLGDNIGEFAEAMLRSKEAKGTTAERFIKSVRNTKAAFLAANLAICAGMLGYVLPKIQYLYREKVYGNKEFPGTRAYEKEAKKILEA